MIDAVVEDHSWLGLVLSSLAADGMQFKDAHLVKFTSFSGDHTYGFAFKKQLYQE